MDSLASKRNDPAERSLTFSVIFFSDANQTPDHKYQLVFDIATFADQHGFQAVWMPERHFHPFGGIYPNPSVLAAALAMKTQQIRLRSGSVVLPLHHPLEVVEAWAMIDHLSGGRVDLGFASGWNPNDFVLSPTTYANLREVWQQRIPLVQQLWRGETMTFMNGQGEEVALQVYPKPLQAELNVWLTISKSVDSFRYAGSQGYHVLTMLQGIDLNELGQKIQVYRTARQENGFDPAEGIVTLMLHTLVHRDLKTVEAAVREPFWAYIKSALTGHVQQVAKDQRPGEAELNKMVDYSYERYFKTGALFGSVSDAEKVAEKARSVGVNEIACLMDFGVEHAVVMDSLAYLKALKNSVTRSAKC
ncbi:MAG: LLM class flavin-dependent oxidoreductase [Anaerolineae bacterium]|nr:LLM class flavin-dependent oxidoreductase [Anaerolineae bacterium]